MKRETRIGIVSDIHADAQALERALTLLEGLGVSKIVSCGDWVQKGPDGERVVEMMGEWLVASVRGNHDENAVLDADLEALRGPDDPVEALDDLSAGAVEALRALPRVRVYMWEWVSVMFAHGTPRDTGEYVFARKIPKGFRKVLRSHPADVIALGHTHRPMWVWWEDVMLINPGSVCGRRTRDSGTCGVLRLPSMEFEVYDVASGERVELGESWYGEAVEISP